MVRAGRAVDKAVVNYSDDVDDNEEEEVEERPKVAKKSRVPNGAKRSYQESGDEASEEEETQKNDENYAMGDDDSDDDFADDGELEGDDSDYGAKKNSSKKKPKKKTATPAKKKKNAAVAKKTPVRGRGRPPKPVQDSMDSEESEEEEIEPTRVTKKGKNAKNKTPSKTATSGRGRPRNTVQYKEDDWDEEEEEEEDDYDSNDDELYNGRKKSNPKGKTKAPTKNKLQKNISEMVPQAIKALAENPKKGSSMSSIKKYMKETWACDTKKLAPKINAFIVNAVEDGEIIRKSGSGAIGRFTLKGMKVKRKKRKQKVIHSESEGEAVDAAEYKPVRRTRDEEREKEELEKEERRLKRKEEELRIQQEKANRPKREMAKKVDYEVEFIKARKVVNDATWYQVKFQGWKKPSWEPEENLTGCQDMIDNFLLEEKVRRAEEEDRRRREEEEGNYEVGKILEVKFPKGKPREFLIRWKGHGEELDSWEPEDNLECHDLIARFMDRHSQRLQVSEKSLRAAPKRVDRLNFATINSRQSKRNHGLRITYEDMDE